LSTDETDLMTAGALLATLRRRWLVVAGCTVLGLLAGAAGAVLLPSYYRAEMTLTPAADLTSSSAGGLGALASQFGGVASLAGINLGASGSDRATVTLETLRGQAFLVDFAKRRGLVVPLFAANGVNKQTGELTINPAVYDERLKQWHERGLLTKRTAPTDGEIYRAITRVVKITQDRRSGVVVVTVDSRSPTLAVAWVKMLIRDLNDFIRTRDSEEAKRTMVYLDQQIAQTQIQDMRQIFYRLFEEQTKTVMLAQVRAEYALKIVDSPVVPDRPVWPGRSALFAIGGLGGVVLGCLLALLGHRRPPNRRRGLSPAAPT